MFLLKLQGLFHNNTPSNTGAVPTTSATILTD